MICSEGHLGMLLSDVAFPKVLTTITRFYYFPSMLLEMASTNGYDFLGHFAALWTAHMLLAPVTYTFNSEHMQTAVSYTHLTLPTNREV